MSQSDSAKPSAFMAQALGLAREVQGRTSPNPAVGAVIVKDGRIVGEGATERPGDRHAEVVALQAAGDAAQGATLYVTLEPCCHAGRTSACTDAVLASGITEVHFSHVDPNEQVSGKGKTQLEEAGLTVTVGDGEAEACRIIEGYLTNRRLGRPFVIAKFAASLDGKIAATSGDSRWVSGPETRAWSHAYRTRIDAIAIGVSTVVVDNPQLTARPNDELSEHQPLRVVIDSKGRTPEDAGVLSCDASTMIATTAASPEAWRTAMTSAGARVEVLPEDANGHVSVKALLEVLAKMDILILLVEGGGVLHGSFFDEGLVDKVHAVIAPLIVGGDAPSAVVGRGAERMADALRLNDITVKHLGDDLLIMGYTSAGAIVT